MASAVFLLLGAYTLLMQVIVLRESFLLFAGNELCVALQLGLWLCLTAAGSAAGAVLPRRAALRLLVALPLTGIWAVCVVRLLPLVLPVPLGLEVPLGWALATLALALAPLNLTAGALFAVACRFFTAGRRANEGAAIGRFYLLETIGATIAGAAFTFVLAGRIRGINLAFWISAAAAGVVAVLLWRLAARARFVAADACLLLVGIAILFPPAGVLDQIWWRTRLAGGHLEAHESRWSTVESPYGRLDVLAAGGQHTLYENGLPVITLEDRDEPLSGYRMADFFLSLHPYPRRILVLGNGEPGLRERVRAWGAQAGAADYVFLPPACLALALRHGGEPHSIPPAPVRDTCDDGRRYLRTTTNTYDLIILDLPAPSTAAGNRFFTVQAFRAARARLREGGILIFQMPSLPHYVAGESAMLLASVHRALLAAFEHVHVLAGESMVFVAGLSEPPRLQTLAERYAQRNPAVCLAERTITNAPDKIELFRVFYEPWFEDFRQREQMAALAAAHAPANDDARPIAYYLNLRRWLREIGFKPRSAERFFAAAEEAAGFVHRFGIAIAVATLLLVFVPVGVLVARRPQGSPSRRGILVLAVLVSGFAGMLGELSLVFMYQNAFGQIYRAVGGLFATYMLGLAAGSALTIDRGTTRERRLALLVLTRALMIVSCGAAVVLANLPGGGAFFIALFLYSLALGMEYPVINRIYREDERGPRAAGVLYGMDLLGAAIAAFLGTTFILPLLGPTAILTTIAALHLVFLSVWLTFTFLPADSA